jgi:hypothetical protein
MCPTLSGAKNTTPTPGLRRCIMIIDYKSLLSEVCALQLNYKRLNDVELGDETYSIVFKDVKDLQGKTETRFFLRNTKKEDYGLTLRQLSALRLATGKITASWFDDFKEDANGAVLQDKAREIAEAGGTLETIKFKVVAQLKVKNDHVHVANTPIYQDRCYTGVAEYSTGLRDLRKGKGTNFWETPEYSFGIRDLREKLHATPLKPGKDVEANIVKLPIFEVI